MSEKKLLIVAAVALIDADNRVLISRRPADKLQGGLWEFPGGKLEPGETPEAALLREIREELGISLKDKCLAPLTFASHSYEWFHLLMPLYVARRWDGTITPHEGQELAWVRANRLNDYPLVPADIPLIAILQDWL